MKRRLFDLGTWRRRDASGTSVMKWTHITLRAEALVREGMTPDEAEAEARRMFAIDNSTIEQLHDIALDRNRHMRFYERWMPSVRTRVTRRAALREPAVTAFIIGTLALGIGINVTAFSVVDRVPCAARNTREPERLVRLYSRVDQPPAGLRTMPWLPYTAFTALRGGMRTIEGWAPIESTRRWSGAERTHKCGQSPEPAATSSPCSESDRCGDASALAKMRPL